MRLKSLLQFFVGCLIASGGLVGVKAIDTSLFNTNTLFIEAEDVDFGHGKYVTDKKIGMDGPYDGGAYKGLGTADDSNFDWNANHNGNQNGYRMDGPDAGKHNGSAGNDRGYFKVKDWWTLGWNDAGEWYNYTRVFPTPAQDYFVIGHLSSGGSPINIQLDQITAGQGQDDSIQVKKLLGVFAPGRATANWDTLELFALTDTNGNVATVNLSGKTTLRTTILPDSNSDQDYFAFVPAAAPLLMSFQASPEQLIIQLADAPKAAVDASSVKVQLNGQALTGGKIAKSGNITGITNAISPILPSGSTNTAVVSFKDSAGKSSSLSTTFTVARYAYLTADMKATPDTSKPGFIVNWSQVASTPGYSQNSIARTEAQLAGKLGPNLADPSVTGPATGPGKVIGGPNDPIQFEVPTVINMDKAAVDHGHVTPDDQEPGTPGTNGGTDNQAAEFLTYITFPAAGAYTMGVNSDDGFKTTAGNVRDIFRAQFGGQFDGGRGAADTTFVVRVADAGTYPFRTIWENGGGDSNVEWWTVDKDDQGNLVYHLINDTADPKALKSYRAATGVAKPTYVSGVTPSIGEVKASPGTSVQVTIVEGDNKVDMSSIKLAVDGANVTPTVNKTGSTIQVSYQPSTPFTANSTHSASITFNPGQSRTDSWSFTVPPVTKDKVKGYTGLILGSAKYTPDQGGHTGKAGDFAIDLGRGSENQSVLIPNADFLNAAAANDTMSFSVWVKLHDVADSSVFWADSPSSGGGERGFQAHTPWSNNNVYFDTAGCCDGSTQRIQAGIDTFPDYTGNQDWWTNWHHFVFTKNASTKTIWIDGKQFLQGDNTNPLPTDFAEIWLGAEGGGPNAGTGHNMHGWIDDFAAFGTALSQADVTKLASGTAPTSLDSSTKLLAYWDFNDAGAAPPAAAKFTSVKIAAGQITIAWTGTGMLQSADSVTGPWKDLGALSSPQSFATSGSAKFYRIKQ